MDRAVTFYNWFSFTIAFGKPASGNAARAVDSLNDREAMRGEEIGRSYRYIKRRGAHRVRARAR